MPGRGETLIVGAGLAGLAAALSCHRQDRDYLLVEKEAEVGGLCRTVYQDGFAFDLTGHLLHLRSQEAIDLVDRLLPDAFLKVARRARINFQDRLVRYPFQVNLLDLPIDIRKECLVGFLKAAAAKEPTHRSGSYHDWIVSTFGQGIADHFMLPYNRKLWGCDLRTLSAEWTSRYVPVPEVEAVVSGALGEARDDLGYNAAFLYPKQGGIDLLPKALAGDLAGPPAQDSLEAVALEKKEATFASGRAVRYSRLISTIPLPELVRRCGDLPSRLQEGARRLRHVSVQVLNLGLRGEPSTDAHWIYFADPKVPFYRVGSPSNFSQGVAPEGCQSLYVEVSRQPGVRWDASFEREVVAALVSQGLLRDPEAIVSRHRVTIPYAYVLYDRHRREFLSRLLGYLEARGVVSTGRYGAWEYGSMESAIREGLAAGNR